MLDTQVARLVSATVRDEQVQSDTGAGLRQALKHACFPWRWGRAELARQNESLRFQIDTLVTDEGLREELLGDRGEN